MFGDVVKFGYHAGLSHRWPRVQVSSSPPERVLRGSLFIDGVSSGIVSEDTCREKDLPVNIFLTSF